MNTEAENRTAAVSQTEKPRRNARTVLLTVVCLLILSAVVLALADARHPQFHVVGGLELEAAYGEPFEDPGIYAVLTGRIFGTWKRHLPLRTEGEVDPSVPGVCELVSTVEYRGRQYVCVRTVRVSEPTAPEPDETGAAEPEEKIIFLTFDDGPSPYTARLLDVLAAYDVKATFFVTCDQPDCFACIGRAHADGHSIGIHTASHVYREIYADEEAFFSDFQKVQDLIVEQTGEETRLYRFPGGSANTVSDFNPGIITRLAAELEERGYQYFDWNVYSGDAGGKGATTSADGVYTNVTEGIAGLEDSSFAVVLQHDIKPYSVDAVERIIQWGLENGYCFRALDVTSPPVHDIIAN